MRSKYIDKNTISKLRSVIGSEKWLPLRISLETGLRIGDVVDLLYKQFHRVRDPETKKYKYFVTTTSQKTKKTGDFQISESLFKLVRERRRELEREDSFNLFLFPSYGESGHLTRQAAWSRMKRAAQELGISGDGISPHSLRKCFAVALMREHGLAAVREALQHSNDAVSRVYAYADTIMNFDSDAPIRWCDLEIIVDYIIDRLREKTVDNSS